MERIKSIYSQEYTNLINLLTSERKRLGLSQVEVAKKIGMLQSDISKIENFERRLDVLELKELLTTYRVTENIILKNYVIEFLTGAL